MFIFTVFLLNLFSRNSPRFGDVIFKICLYSLRFGDETLELISSLCFSYFLSYLPVLCGGLLAYYIAIHALFTMLDTRDS